MVIKGDDGGFLTIGKSKDNDIWINVTNDMHSPVRIRTFFGGGGNEEVYKAFNTLISHLEEINSNMVVK